jgi:hypothetical protein
MSERLPVLNDSRGHNRTDAGKFFQFFGRRSVDV